MKKQGSVLVEVMASIMILMLTTTFVVNTCMQNNRVLKERILREEVDRAVCNLVKEFKYNMSKKEIEDVLVEGKIGFEYDKKFSERLLTEYDITKLKAGEDIEVCKIGKDDFGLKLKVVANIRSEGNIVNVEKEFTKSWWMDEI